MKKSLLKQWQDYKNNPSIKPTINYAYAAFELGFAEQILQALTFWQFVRKEVSVDARKEFCRKFFMDPNDLISLVAHIEFLPDKVWRKLLWVENIDFVDYEATLRRMTRDQEHAIVEAVSSLLLPEPAIPKVFLKNFWDMLKVLLGLITPAKLLAGPYGKKSRYFTKGAWAFNLLSIDFGFSLYPHGINDDTQIINKKFSRFLSIKEHINDFVVNREDGVYWLLFKSARSNFVWFSNKKFNLEDYKHVCPGFWKTLLIHLLFWIVSPIGFAIMSIIWMKTGSFPFQVYSSSFGAFFTVIQGIGATITCLLLSFTPLWLTLAAIKIVVSLLSIFIESIAPPVGRFLIKVGKGIGEIADVIDEITDTKIAKIVGKILKWLFVSVIILCIFTIIVFLCTKIWPFLITFAHFIVSFVKDLFLGVSNHPYSTAWSILALTVIVFSSSVMFSTKFEDREYARYDKMIRRSVWVWIIISVIMGYLTFSKENIFDYGSNFSLMMVYILNFFAFVLISVLGMETMTINMDTVEKRVESKSKACNIPLNMYRGDYDRAKLYISKFRNLLMKNEWILSIKYEDYQTLLGKLNEIIDKNYGFCGRNKDRFLFIVLPIMNQDLVNRLSRDIPKNLIFDIDKFHYLHCLCDGMSYKDALKETMYGVSVNKKKNERKNRRQKKFDHLFVVVAAWSNKFIFKPTLLFLGILVWPLVKLWQGVAQAAKWLKRFSLTLKDLWSLFNERCPYISKSEFLE